MCVSPENLDAARVTEDEKRMEREACANQDASIREDYGNFFMNPRFERQNMLGRPGKDAAEADGRTGWRGRNRNAA
jgi:hypothetical protein